MFNLFEQVILFIGKFKKIYAQKKSKKVFLIKPKDKKTVHNSCNLEKYQIIFAYTSHLSRVKKSRQFKK
jgi:hypothetical protein